MSVNQNTIPNLDHYSGSWIIVSRETRKAVFETFSRSIANKINQYKYECLTALQYLSGLNQ